MASLVYDIVASAARVPLFSVRMVPEPVQTILQRCLISEVGP
jgi:hypothetical protein